MGIANIEFQSLEQRNFMKSLKIVNDLYTGSEAIKGTGEYLTKFQLETQDNFVRRLQNAYLYNYFKKTINNLTSILIRKSAIFTIETEKMRYLETNIDNQGSSLNSFLKLVTKNVLIDGISWIWADATTAPETMERKYEQRVFLKNIKATQILSLKTENIGGSNILTQAVIKESYKKYTDDFAYKNVDRFIVLKTDKIAVYERNGVAYKEIYKIHNDLGYIPLYPIYAEKTGLYASEIPFLDLAYLNIKHFNETSNYDNIKTLACVPVPLVFSENEFDDKVLNKNGVSIGVSTALSFKDKTKEGFQWSQVDAGCMQELRANLKDLEDKMEGLSFSILSRASFNTATEAEIADNQSGLFLIEIVHSLEDCFRKCFQTFSDFTNIDIKYKLDLNKDFNSRLLSKDYISTLIDLRSRNLISTDTLWNTLVKGEIIDIKDYEAERDKIANDDLNTINTGI